jgi:hypothetical protein
MKFVVHQHRFGLDLVNSNQELGQLWNEITNVLESISDEDIKKEFLDPPKFHPVKKTRAGAAGKRKSNRMSISAAINNLIEDGLVSKGWLDQSKIFQGKEYKTQRWLLDFSKRIKNPTEGLSGFAVEVAFNHGEAICWNLMKPELAADKNNVKTETDIGFGVGIYICATAKLKKDGAFDSAVGEYEKVLRYLEPMSSKLICPLIIIGLKEPTTFYIKKQKHETKNYNIGKIINK